MSTEIDSEQIVGDIVGRLSRKFPELDSARIERVAREKVAEFEGRPVRDYVAVLAERAAKKQLKES